MNTPAILDVSLRGPFSKMPHIARALRQDCTRTGIAEKSSIHLRNRTRQHHERSRDRRGVLRSWKTAAGGVDFVCDILAQVHAKTVVREERSKRIAFVDAVIDDKPNDSPELDSVAALDPAHVVINLMHGDRSSYRTRAKVLDVRKGPHVKQRASNSRLIYSQPGISITRGINEVGTKLTLVLDRISSAVIE